MLFGIFWFFEVLLTLLALLTLDLFVLLCMFDRAALLFIRCLLYLNARWVFTLREILRIGRARNIAMPEDDATLNRLFQLVLKNLALPQARQVEMMETMSRKHKWTLIQMNKSKLDSQALADAIQGNSGGNSGKSGPSGSHQSVQVEQDAKKWALRTLENKKEEMHTLSGILALKAVVGTSGLQWLRTFHENGGIAGLLSILKHLGQLSYTPGILFSTKGRIRVLEMQREAMRMLKGFMNNNFGVSAVMGEQDGVNAIVMQFAPMTSHVTSNSDSSGGRKSFKDNVIKTLQTKDHRTIRTLANQVSTLTMGMLSVLCWATGDSSVVLESFINQRALKRENIVFENVVSCLSNEESSSELCTSIITFINDLINNQIDLTSRVKARSPFMTLRMKYHANIFVNRLTLQLKEEKNNERLSVKKSNLTFQEGESKQGKKPSLLNTVNDVPSF